MNIPEYDLRTDVFSKAVPFTSNPDTWPGVRVIHVPSGLVATVCQSSQAEARRLAVEQIKQRLTDLEVGGPR